MAAPQAFPPQRVVATIAGPFFACRGLEPAPWGPAAGAGPEPEPGPGPGPGPEAAAPAETKAGAAVPDGDQVVSDLEQYGYVRLDARRREPRGGRDWVVVLVLGAAGKPAHHSPDLRRLLEGIEAAGAAEAAKRGRAEGLEAAEAAKRLGRLDELIIVAEDAFYGRKHLTDVLADYQARAAAQRRELQARAGTQCRECAAYTAAQRRARACAACARLPGAHPDPAGAAPFLSAYRFRNFALVVPDHKAVPRHRVMGPEEVAEALQRTFQTLDALPVIFDTDPPIVWNGGRSGQVVEITRDSGTAGIALSYRRIRPGPLREPPAAARATAGTPKA